MDESVELRSLKAQIRQTEGEIREIQSCMLVRKSELLRSKQAGIRNSNYANPRTRAAKPKKSIFKGIPEENVQLLHRLEYQITAKTKKRDDLRLQNEEIQKDIDLQIKEIEEKEHRLGELKANVFAAVQKKKEIRSKYELEQQKLAEQKIETKEMKRLVKDTDIAIMGIAQRRDQTPEDRSDQKPIREKLAQLENAIRKAGDANDELEERIRLTDIEVAVPLPYSENEKAALSSLEDPEAESLASDVLVMTEEIKQKERELRKLEWKINRLHARNTAAEERYEMLDRLSEEPINMSETITDETVEQLIERLRNTTEEMAKMESRDAQNVDDMMKTNAELESAIKRRLLELDHAKILLDQETRRLKTQIQAQRDKSFDDEIELVSKIREMQKRLTKNK